MSNWKSSLSALDRYQTIQSLQETLLPDERSNAISIEQDAYTNSSTREEYDAAIRAASHSTEITNLAPSETGIRIGKYEDCIPIAAGVTSEVFRSDGNALKVIIQHNIEPHNPQREASLLREIHSLSPPPENIVALTETFRDQEQQFVLVFPYFPMTLGDVLSSESISPHNVRFIFKDILTGLSFLHKNGIIHRDIKPSAILLQSTSGPACISDFGTAWHPRLSSYTEPRVDKILDIGTGAYRAPEVLFGNKSYDTPIDMWALGVMLAESISSPALPPFESRPAHEDGSQLGLILSIFKTIGTPTAETWPEAKGFKVTPFELWTLFPSHDWEAILPAVDKELRDLVGRLVCFESGRRDTADEALQHASFAGK